jgi:hypothetical protein
MQPQYLDGSSDNFGALSAKLVVRDIETRHLAIGRNKSRPLFVPKESSILLTPVLKGVRGARRGGAGRGGGGSAEEGGRGLISSETQREATTWEKRGAMHMKSRGETAR